MDSHAGVQVPELHLLAVYSHEHGGAVGGPADGEHLALDRCEAQQRFQAPLPPQLDGTVRGAAQEHIWTEGRPLNVMDGRLETRGQPWETEVPEQT